MITYTLLVSGVFGKNWQCEFDNVNRITAYQKEDIPLLFKCYPKFGTEVLTILCDVEKKKTGRKISPMLLQM